MSKILMYSPRDNKRCCPSSLYHFARIRRANFSYDLEEERRDQIKRATRAKCAADSQTEREQETFKHKRAASSDMIATTTENTTSLDSARPNSTLETGQSVSISIITATSLDSAQSSSTLEDQARAAESAFHTLEGIARTTAHQAVGPHVEYQQSVISSPNRNLAPSSLGGLQP